MKMSTTMNTINTTTMTTNKIVYRKCVVSKEIINRVELIRIVKTPSGVILIQKDEKHIPGRGVYIKKDKNIILEGQKRDVLSRALRAKVDKQIYIDLLAMC